MERQIWI
jgi:hypothetical protein